MKTYIKATPEELAILDSNPRLINIAVSIYNRRWLKARPTSPFIKSEESLAEALLRLVRERHFIVLNWILGHLAYERSKMNAYQKKRYRLAKGRDPEIPGYLRPEFEPARKWLGEQLASRPNVKLRELAAEHGVTHQAISLMVIRWFPKFRRRKKALPATTRAFTLR